MKALLSTVALSLALASCAKGGTCVTPPGAPATAPAVSNEQLGDRCDPENSFCASTLICDPGPLGLPSLCTLDCSSTPCPAGSMCLSSGGRLSPSLCVASCSSAADCRPLFYSVACVALDAGAPSVCQPVACTQDADCPAGDFCEVLGTRCGDPPFLGGWCRPAS